MRTKWKAILFVALLVLIPVFTASPAHAQITSRIGFTVSHPFVVENTTLPPGHYILYHLNPLVRNIMVIESAKPGTAVEVLVRSARDNHVPQHTELVFNRYGKKEFLHKIFESGSRLGVALPDTSREELRLQKAGQHGFEHTESGQ